MARRGMLVVLCLLLAATHSAAQVMRPLSINPTLTARRSRRSEGPRPLEAQTLGAGALAASGDGDGPPPLDIKPTCARRARGVPRMRPGGWRLAGRGRPRPRAAAHSFPRLRAPTNPGALRPRR